MRRCLFSGLARATFMCCWLEGTPCFFLCSCIKIDQSVLEEIWFDRLFSGLALLAILWRETEHFFNNFERGLPDNYSSEVSFRRSLLYVYAEDKQQDTGNGAWKSLPRYANKTLLSFLAGMKSHFTEKAVAIKNTFVTSALLARSERQSYWNLP